MYAVGRLSNYISQGVYSVAAPFHPFGGAVDIIVVQQEDGTFKCSPWYVKFGKFQGVLKRREKIVTVSVNGKEAGFHMYLDHKGEAYFLKEAESDEEASIFSPPSAPSSGDEIVVDRRSSGRRISFKEGTFKTEENVTISSKDSFKTEENATSVPRAGERLKSATSDDVVLSHNKEENSGSFSEQSMNPNMEEKQCESGMADSSGAQSSPVKNGKIHSKSPSRRKSILSFVFRRSQRSSELQVVASDTDQNDEQRERNEFGRSKSLEQAKLIADLLDTKWANGDKDNKEGMEMNVFSSSVGDEAQSLDLSGKLSEQHMISDGNRPLPQYKDPVGSIANQEDYVQDSEKQDEETNGDYLHVVCHHDVESSADNCANIDNSVEQSDPEACQSQTESVIFSMEETLNKLNKFDEQNSRNNVAEHSEGSIHNQADINSQDQYTPDPVLLYNVITDVEKGSSKFDEFREKTFENNIASQSSSFACDQDHEQSPQSKTLNLAELSKSGVDILSTRIDDSQDARLTHVSSLDLPSEVSELITPLPDVGPGSELCGESERICKIQQVVDNVLQCPTCSSCEQELMEHNREEEDLQPTNSIVELTESSCDYITSPSLSGGCNYPTNSLLPHPCDTVLCAETCEGTKTVQQVSDDEVEFVTNGGENGINKITSEARTDNEVAIHVIDQKELNRSSFCDYDAPRETIIRDQKLVSEEASNRASNLLDLVDDKDSCTPSNLGTMTSQVMLDSAIEPSTGGRNDETEQSPCSVKLDEEAFIHAMCAKQLDGSSGFDTNRNDQRLVPKETFNYTNAQEEDMEVTLPCNNLIYCKLDNAHEVHFQMQHEVCKLECSVSNNNSAKLNEAHIEIEETDSNQTISSDTSQDLEMNFNDEYVLSSGLALSEFHPTIQEGTRKHELSLCIGVEGQAGSVSEDENSNEELVSSDQQPNDNHTSILLESNVSKSIGDSSLEYSNDNGSQLSRIENAPINILRCTEGKEDTMRASGSLPNLGSNFFDMTNTDTGHVFGRSLDSHSSYLKQGVNYEPPFSNSQNTESRDSEKEAAQNWTTRENSGSSKIWTTTEAARASVHPYYRAIEISLCRHLLFEGMGTDAAAETFDSFKVSSDQFLNSRANITNNENLVVRMGGRYFSWDAVAPIILGMVAFGLEGPPELDGAIAVEQAEKALQKFASDSFVTSGGGWGIWRFLRRRSKTPERSISAQIISGNDLIGSESQASFDSSFSDYYRKTGKSKERSNTPTSEQLASLNLNEGQNIITFTFSTRVLGKQQVDARIYLWKWNTQIVVSDVDGTITKSDVLGQFMPLVGKDWTQSGVAQLFSAIKDNGYQLMFLSARAIAQAYITRQFLLNIKQDGKALPDGPIVISPDGLFPSLYREVIRRAPHEFKIACLEDIRKLFPPDCNPFYAGFGNRDTDEISYLKVGIPKGKIFIINPKGEVAVNHRVDMKSYTSLHSLVNGMFPAMSSSEQEDFNSWNYWKMPLPNIDV